ncbi:MAG TPA: GNAT family N-acetyltransferase [Intrasporangium sp.]|uniref:GNAT family N-acetyltransferase n=1 Tax=Intrasporangium sp. TaxID=1925024 RepID=UPI002D76E349|nr:GNAT family N-acetyltransferase [Intrasporangium sp.]HET7397918.1 GNAT family N-acetyltransferase [Intrasporangium sp.]
MAPSQHAPDPADGPDDPHAHPHEHSHAHEHPHAHDPGPLADASVRLARPADVPAVALVQSVVLREAYAAVLAPEAVAQLEPGALAAVWRRSLAEPPTPDHVLLVACAGEQVVGFAAVGPSSDPDATAETAELLVLGVHPAARRQGHGSRLLNAAVDTVRGRGRTELDAWLLASDDAGRAFLLAAGLQPDGAHRARVVSPDGRAEREVRLSARVDDSRQHGADT